MNAIKLILQRKNQQQKILVKAKNNEISRQCVSKYVLRQRKIPVSVAAYWEDVLKVPSSYFVDEEGYCKILNIDEEYELHNYLSIGTLANSQFRACTEIEILERSQDVEKNVRKIQKKLREDIYYVDNFQDLNSALDSFEKNIHFYNEVLSLRKTRAVSDGEWGSIIKALWLLRGERKNQIAANDLAAVIYNAIVNQRERLEKQQKEDYDMYCELFCDN